MSPYSEVPVNTYSEVRSYSSYTKGLYEISQIVRDDDFISFIIEVPLTFCTKLEKRIKKFQVSTLAMDGVTANVIISPDRQSEQIQIIAAIAKERFLKSSLVNLREHDFVSIGLLSVNPKKYLVDARNPSVVTLHKAQKVEGHSCTMEFTFACTKEQFSQIKDLQYVGINGSGFFIQSRIENEDRYYFSVHAWQETQDKTVFNDKYPPMNTEFTLTLPFKS